jgi:signal transduction histidine kinase
MAESEPMVPVRSIMVFAAYLAKLGCALEPLLEGLSIDRTRLEDPRYRISWSVLGQFLERLEVAISPMSLDQFGESGPELEGNEWFARLAGYFADTKLIYWAMARAFVPFYFPFIRAEYRNVGGRRAELEFTLPEHVTASRQFFLVWLGGIRATPKTLGQGPALVEAKIEPRRAVFRILCPPPLTWGRRAARAVKMVFAARSAIEEIAMHQVEFERFYREQLESSTRLAEQEARLRVAASIEAASRLTTLGEIAGGIAHEINNPLAAIVLRIERLTRLAKAGKATIDDAVTELATVKAQVLRIDRIVSGLLSFARKTDQEESGVVGIDKLIQEVLALCGQTLGEAGVEVRTEIAPPDLELHCRPTQLSQVLMNLLMNASDAVSALPEKWIRIEARVDPPRAGAPSFVEIAVIDSGHGVPEANREKLFQPFFTTKPVGSGTGLGAQHLQRPRGRAGWNADSRHPQPAHALLDPAPVSALTSPGFALDL